MFSFVNLKNLMLHCKSLDHDFVEGSTGIAETKGIKYHVGSSE